MKLAEKVALITGAASGIGEQLAYQLAGHGARLALVDRDAEGLARVAAALTARTPEHPPSVHCMDLLDSVAIKALPAAVLEVHGAVHLLINNAGVAAGGRFLDVTEEDFDWVMAVNFNATVRMTRAFLPILLNQPAARIVNLSSVFGLISPAGQAAYSASKFAVRGFSNALRHELIGTSVGLTVVHPGGVATAIARNARKPPQMSEQEIVQAVRRTESKLRMSPHKAAAIILDGVQRDRSRVIVGTDARVASLLERLLPVGYWQLMKGQFT